jgi:hypothetical protein
MATDGQQRTSTVFYGHSGSSSTRGRCLHVAGIGCTVGTGARRALPKSAGLNAQGYRPISRSLFPARTCRPGSGLPDRGVQGRQGDHLPGPLEGGNQQWREGFRTAAQADSFRSALLTATRKGEAFSLATGRPMAWERTKADISWYEFACAYVDMKWKQASAKYRKDIARALTAATPAMLAEVRGRPDDASIRRALTRWGFNTEQRMSPPDDVAQVLAWVARNTAPVSALAGPVTARRMLDHATGTVDGKIAAASTGRRHRTILANAMDDAIERGLLETNPVGALKWTAPKVSGQVDREASSTPTRRGRYSMPSEPSSPGGPGSSPSSQSCTTPGCVPRRPTI